ncbi:MAG TPA: fatty acyl-AMP ligase [Oscillatoriaceae cyanobacterium]
MAFDPEHDWRRHGDTLPALLETRAGTHGDRTFVTLITEEGEQALGHRALLEGARAVAGALQARGVKPGDRVALVLPTGRAFLECFFGILMAGAIAVPLYPPARTRGLAEYRARLARLLSSATPSVIVTFPRVRMIVEAAAHEAGVRASVHVPEGFSGEYRPVAITSEAIALIQFSSGSTGTPRGVMLSHRQLLANVASVLEVIQPTTSDVNCSWLPLYHDMGLIGGLFMPLFCGQPLVLLSPQLFLLDPKRWLRAIHTHRATISTAPNFAYQLLAMRLDDAELAGLDLSCWRLALCGAEPVAPATLDAFVARMAPYGFDARALLPVYGLAEAALGAVFPEPGAGARLDHIDRVALAEGQAKAEAAGVAYTSVGRPLPGFAVRIADADGQALAERRVGEIQLRGPSIMTGYWNAPDASATAFADGWLRTGDLGYMADGELYIVGRAKDLIVKGGRNYAPQDLERACEDVAGVRKGCCVAFGVPDDALGTETLVIVAETREPSEGHAALARTIIDRVLAESDLRPDQVALVPPGTVPKTSSGKLQRSLCRERWLAGTLLPAQEPGVLEMTRVVGRAIAQRLGVPGGSRRG